MRCTVSPRAAILGLQVGVASFALLAAGASGCGGATSQEVFDSPPSTATSSGTSGTSGAATSGGTSGTSGNTSGSAGTSGNPTTSGGLVDAATDAPVGGDCPSETEPNDTRGEANTLSTSLCGAIHPANEPDFLTFQLKGSTTSMQITFTGQVTLRVDVNGQTVLLGTGLSPKVPFVKGKPYIIEVRPIDEKAAPVPWRVNLIEM